MNQKEQNAASAANMPNEQTKEKHHLAMDIPYSIQIKEERMNDEESFINGQAISDNSFAAVKLEPDDVCGRIEKITLPFQPNENFWDENQEFSTTGTDGVSAYYFEPKLEPFYRPSQEIEHVVISIPDEIISMPFTAPSSVEQEMLLDSEVKIEIADAWDYNSNIKLPDVSKLFLSQSFEGNDKHDANESENHNIKNMLKRSKHQTYENKKKLCSKSIALQGLTESQIKPVMKNASTWCPLQVNDDSDTESCTSFDSLHDSIENSGLFICHLCSITYTNLDLLSDHISEYHKNYKYCTKCKFLIKTNNKSAVKKHEATCCKLVDIQKYYYVGKAKKKTHRKIKNNVSSKNLYKDLQELKHFICHLCNENYCSLQAVNEHVAKHHKKYMYCVKCRFLIKVSNKMELSNHEQQCCKVVTNKTFVICNYCIKPFLSVAKMLKHVKVKHSGDKNIVMNNSSSDCKYKLIYIFKCSFCLAAYQNETTIKTHVSQQHNKYVNSKINVAVYRKQIYVKCIYCSQCFQNLSIIHSHISSNHPDKCNITKIDLDLNNVGVKTNIVKIETGTQTNFEDFDLDYLEYTLKLKKMDDLYMQNESGPIKSKKSQAANTSPIKTYPNSTDSQTNKICKESFAPILNTCNSFCTTAINSEAVKKFGYKLAVHCRGCSLDILAESYFSRHLVLCVCQSESVQCIFCTQEFSIDKNIFTYISHIKQHFSNSNLIASQCTNCKLSFFCAFNKTIHEQSKNCKLLNVTTKTYKKTSVATAPTLQAVDNFTCNETKKTLQENHMTCMQIINGLKKGEYLSIYCVSCNTNFGAFEFINFHINKCLKDGKTVCSFCNQHAASNILEALQNIKSHVDKEYKKITCNKCKAVFLNLYNRDKHLQTHGQATTNPERQPPKRVSLLKKNNLQGTKVAIQKSATISHDKNSGADLSHTLISLPKIVQNKNVKGISKMPSASTRPIPTTITCPLPTVATLPQSFATTSYVLAINLSNPTVCTYQMNIFK